MSELRSNSEDKALEGSSPFEPWQRQSGLFAPFPLGTRRILPLTALHPARGGQHRGVVDVLSAANSGARAAPTFLSRTDPKGVM